jgi:hypothetical protein
MTKEEAINILTKYAELQTALSDIARKMAKIRGVRTSSVEVMFDPFVNPERTAIAVTVSWYAYGEDENLYLTVPLDYLNNPNWERLDKMEHNEERAEESIDRKLNIYYANLESLRVREEAELKELARLKKKYENGTDD